jgi:hypothetical protein
MYSMYVSVLSMYDFSECTILRPLCIVILFYFKILTNMCSFVLNFQGQSNTTVCVNCTVQHKAQQKLQKMLYINPRGPRTEKETKE